MSSVPACSRKLSGCTVAYWTGAVVDAVMVVPLFVPGVAAAMLGVNAFAGRTGTSPG